MTHELEQFVYGLDVAEVGVEEANRRWEYYTFHRGWVVCQMRPTWADDYEYRRKPGLPMPVVVPVRGAGTVDQFFDSGVSNSLAIPELANQATEWPADAPGWANYLTTDSNGQKAFHDNLPYLDCGVWVRKTLGMRLLVNDVRPVCITRPQPPKRKIDWSKLSEFAERYCEFDEDGDIRFPSLWIPWNINSLGGDCPVPDGVRIAYHCANTGYRFNDASCAPWGEITAFRITGIADGWE